MHTLPECTAPVASPLKPLPTENFYQSNIHVSGTTLAARHMIQINRDTPEMRRQLGSDPLLAKRKLKRSSKSFGYAFVTGYPVHASRLVRDFSEKGSSSVAR